jgi:hypothetical protein
MPSRSVRHNRPLLPRGRTLAGSSRKSEKGRELLRRFAAASVRFNISIARDPPFRSRPAPEIQTGPISDGDERLGVLGFTRRLAKSPIAVRSRRPGAVKRLRRSGAALRPLRGASAGGARKRSRLAGASSIGCPGSNSDPFHMRLAYSQIIHFLNDVAQFATQCRAYD